MTPSYTTPYNGSNYLSPILVTETHKGGVFYHGLLCSLSFDNWTNEPSVSYRSPVAEFLCFPRVAFMASDAPPVYMSMPWGGRLPADAPLGAKEE